MKEITDISLLDLAFGAGLFVIPVLMLRYYGIPMINGLLMAVTRMTLQLSLIALYLEWVFDQNSAWINGVWVLIMVMVGVFTTINRIGLNWKTFIVPFTIAGITSIAIIDAFFLGVIIRLDYVFDARYFIPITGMILGNALNHNIVGLSTYFDGLRDKRELYHFLLTNTGQVKLALRPFISEALTKALNPMIASMSVMGLISLPGMMTGQILGGSSPATAIKYQIMIMIAIFVGCTLNLLLSILLANRQMLDAYGIVKKLHR